MIKKDRIIPVKIDKGLLTNPTRKDNKQIKVIGMNKLVFK